MISIRSRTALRMAAGLTVRTCNCAVSISETYWSTVGFTRGHLFKNRSTDLWRSSFESHDRLSTRSQSWRSAAKLTLTVKLPPYLLRTAAARDALVMDGDGSHRGVLRSLRPSVSLPEHRGHAHCPKRARRRGLARCQRPPQARASPGTRSPSSPSRSSLAEASGSGTPFRSVDESWRLAQSSGYSSCTS